MMNLLIVEDVKETCDFLTSVIRKHYPAIQCDHAYTFDEATRKMTDITYDFFIIDYELDRTNASKNGITLGKTISEQKKYKNTPILMETSYPEYVLNAVNSLHCLYYLVKPFKETDIIDMLKKVFHILVPEAKLLFHNNMGIKTILSVSDIIYIKSERHYIKVTTVKNTFFFVNYSLTRLEKDSGQLLNRCHKSYLINPDYISFIDKTNQYITLEWASQKETIPVGRKYGEQIYENYLSKHNNKGFR